MVMHCSYITWILLAMGVLFLTMGCTQQPVQRYGMVIGIEEQNIPEYKKLHAEAWPGVLKKIDKCHIQNYSIYLGEAKPGKHYLFGYYEYTGRDYQADMAKMKKDETTQKWWKHTDPLQVPLATRQEGEWWANWEEVFHFAGAPSDKKPARYGSIIGIAKENLLAYTQLHAAVWPGVLAAIERCNIRNYSIYLGQIEPDQYLLFSYFEYIGDDFEKDMKDIADEVTKKWWTYTDPLQIPLETRKEGEWWKSMEEVFHMD